MHIATRLISYFGVLGALIGGGASALLLLAPEPGAATTAPATVQPKPLPPKIAAWQERIAIPLPPSESRTAEPTRPIPAAAAPAPRPVINQPGATARVAQPKQKSKTNRAPVPSESALGYAEAARPVRYEQAVFAFRERPSQ